MVDYMLDTDLVKYRVEIRYRETGEVWSVLYIYGATRDEVRKVFRGYLPWIPSGTKAYVVEID